MSVAADALHAARGALAADGYAIIDGAMEESVTDLLRAQMATLTDAGALRPHVFGFRPSPSEPVAVYTKPHIFEAELGDAAVSACAPKLVAAVEALRLAPLCAEAFPDLDLEPDHATVKLQHNAGGGGCFPYHFDNAGPPSKRALTCLFYLNPDWSDGHGGELVLLPWLRPAVTIAPSVRRTPPAAHATPASRRPARVARAQHGRIVLFRSDCVLHRVRPSAVPRLCFTIWLDTRSADADANLRVPKGLSAGDAVRSHIGAAHLGLSAAQRVLSRHVYAEEYADSLVDCYACAGLGSQRPRAELPPMALAMLKSHEAHVAAAARSAVLAPLVAAARAAKPRGDERYVWPAQRAADACAAAEGAPQVECVLDVLSATTLRMSLAPCAAEAAAGSDVIRLRLPQ